jgi:uncharacterized membrane protein YidH (DUF202 family)
VTAGPADQHPVDDESDDQLERTLLAWRRTALSLVAAGLLVSHLTARNIGPAAIFVTLTGTAAVVGFVWLGHGRRIFVTGLALVLGVLLLAGTALAGVAKG